MSKLAFVIIPMLIAISAMSAISCEGEAAPFSIQVTPQEMQDTVPGQNCVFLITASDEGDGSGSGRGEAVNISATVSGASVTVSPAELDIGKVAEISVIPDEGSIGSEITVTVEAKRKGIIQNESVTLFVNEVRPVLDELAITAANMRDPFIPWLEANHPELGITSEIEWSGTIVRPNIYVVMYYLFFSEEWEMGLRWHVMIPPYDWAEVYLRHRTTEVSPSYAFKISSLEAQEEPQAVQPEELVWR